MATKRKGHLEEVEASTFMLTMKAARRIHRRLRKTGEVRRSFRKWFRVEGRGLGLDLSPKARRIVRQAA